MIHTNIESDFEQFLQALKKYEVPHNQVVNFYPPQLKENKKAFLKDTSSPHTKGVYYGHLYETYVLNKLVNLVPHRPDIDWILTPSLPRQGAPKKKSKLHLKNGMNYNKEGALVLLREGFAVAEFDAILSFRGIPVLFEMKCTSHNKLIDYDAILVRSLRFESVYGKAPFVVIIRNVNRFPNKIIDACNTHFGWFLLNVDNYEPFFADFDQRMQSIPRFTAHSSQFPQVRDIFPKSVDYSLEKSLRNAFMNPRIPSEQLLNLYSSKLRFFTKIPMGKLSYPIHIPLQVKSGSNPITDYIANKIPIVVYLSHNTIDFTLEFIAVKQRKKNANQNIAKCALDLENLVLSNMQRRVTHYSYFYHQAKIIAEDSGVPLISEKKLSLLIKRCQELTCIRHMDNIIR